MLTLQRRLSKSLFFLFFSLFNGLFFPLPTLKLISSERGFEMRKTAIWIVRFGHQTIKLWSVELQPTR